MNRQQLYQPLLERNLENYQIQHLARRYDFGKESRIAEVEDCLGIRRARPFELFLHQHGKDVLLPLFRPEYLKPMLAGGTFSEARKMVLSVTGLNK